MPGILTHLLAGGAIAIIGRIYFRNFFKDNQRFKKNILLAITCLLFSFIPDIFLGIYYTTYILPYHVLGYYHNLNHLVFSPLITIMLVELSLLDKKRRIFWILGSTSLIIHLIMDIFITETGALY